MVIEQALHIPEFTQIVVDCRDGSIALLSPPALAYGSLLGFSRCVFTSFRAGESATAEPSTPQHIFNWDGDNAMLIVEDSFLEVPCSVRSSSSYSKRCA
jgi:hypothetical protein